MKRYSIAMLAGIIVTACGPATFTMDVEMRGPSKSGIDLGDKDISVLYMDNGERRDSLFLASVSEGFAQAIEKDYFGGSEAVGIYRFNKIAGADYASRDTLVNLIMDTGSDVLFLFDIDDGDELELFLYDALNPADSVFRYTGGNVTDRIADAADKVRSLGEAYAEMFLSTWTGGSYPVIYYEAGESAWHTGAVLASGHRWKEAIDAWMTILDTKNLQKRGCAEYNIALACYMSGQKELALEWLDKADEDYFIYPSVELRKLLTE